MQSLFATRRGPIAALLSCLLALAGVTTAAPPYSHEPKPELKFRVSPIKLSGKVEAVAPEGIVLSTASGEKVAVAISQARLWKVFPPTPGGDNKMLQVTLEGTAEPEFLSSGQYVMLSADLKDKQGQGEVKELTLFTPDEETKQGIVSSGPAAGDAEGTGNYLITGQVRGYRNGTLTIIAPDERNRRQQVTVTVAEDAKINLKISEYELARRGDTIEVQGCMLSPDGWIGPNTYLGEKIQIAAAQTIANRKGRRVNPALAKAESKPSKPKSQKAQREADDEAEEEMPPTLADSDAMPEKEKSDSAADPSANDPPPGRLVIKDLFAVDQQAAAASASK